MIKEIGSEFSYSNIPDGNGLVFPREGTLTFSGRTAIESVLAELTGCKSVLLPSYCCASMIEPFKKAGFSVNFFDVDYDNGMKIDINDSADVLLWCNYFGFEIPDFNFDGLVIEDITHSLLSEKSHHQKSDFLVASLRKWMPLYCGGYCSVNSKLSTPPNSFIEKKSRAMSLKTEYLKDLNEHNKQIYLSIFNESNLWLANNYSGLGIDDFSKEYVNHVDIEKQRNARIKNAQVLYEGLNNKVEFLFNKSQIDCPLFVPIALKHNRAAIRQKLIEKDIYCPIHWTKPQEACKSNLYDIELSLICDQRYDENDMDRIVSVLKEAL